MPITSLLIAAGVAFVAGVVNSIAGGGSLILFPALVALGLPTVAANVTNSVSQWPGYIGSVIGFRGRLRGQRGRIVHFSVVAVAGALVGSILLLTTPGAAFDFVVPVLVLLASLLLLLQPIIARRAQLASDAPGRSSRMRFDITLFLATIYGGYFGGALGVILVGVLGLVLPDLKLANALKSVLSMVTATVTIIVFGIFGPVHWEIVAVAAPTGLLGGFLGAKLANRIPSTPLRAFIVVFGVVVAIYLFVSALNGN